MFNAFQIVSLTLFTFINAYDTFHTQVLTYGRSTMCGFMAGLIMGDVTTGLLVGGTMELMSLGVGGYGGSSVPNYYIGAIMGTAFGVATNGGLENGLAIGIPIAALGVQLDVFAKMAGSFFLHKAQSCANDGKLKSMYKWIRLGILPRPLFLTLAVFLGVTAGSSLISVILVSMPAWLLAGLKVAGGILPAVGFGILLRYMPLNKYFVYAVLGFVFASFMGVSVIGVSIIGFCVAFLVYKQNEKLGELTSVSVDKETNYDE